MKRVAVATMVLCAVLLGCAGLRLAGGDASPLYTGLRDVIALTDATVAVAAPDLDVVADAGNADLDTARGLRNNHLLGDSSIRNGDGVALIHDCDHISNVFSDGWYARYGVEIDLPDAGRGLQLLRDTERLWRSRGLDVSTTKLERGGTSLNTAFGQFRYELLVSPAAGAAKLGGETMGCVSAGW